MNQNHQHQQQQQQAPQPQHAPHAGTGQNMGGGAAQMLAPRGVPAHLMGIMTNPALAAAAAASPMFPPAAMLSNPAAFLSMPEVFGTNSNNNNNTGNQQQHQQSSRLAAAAAAAGMGNYGVNGDGSMNNNQVNHQQGHKGMTVMSQQNGQQQQAQQPQQQLHQPAQIIPPTSGSSSKTTEAFSKDDKNKGSAASKRDLTPEERAKQNRDRNREHARSTRLRKKAYVSKLKELVEGLHAERSEEVRQRRVAIHHLAEMQNVRRGVVRTFLRFHSQFEADSRKWETLVEDNFWLKQPVTPYRSFRRTEIEQDCRLSRGVQGMVADAASVAVMVEGIGSRSTRWMQIKREEFFLREEAKRGSSTTRMPQSIVNQENRNQAAVSSLSSSSGSSNGSASDEADKQRKQEAFSGANTRTGPSSTAGGKKVSSSSGSSSDGRGKQLAGASKDFHDYHAQPLPDPKLGDGSSSPSEDSPEESNSSTNGDGVGAAAGSKRVCTDSSSGDDSAAAIAAARSVKRQKTEAASANNASDQNGVTTSAGALPPNIAKTGGITANAMPAPAVQLPPFAGIGKQVAMPVKPPDGDSSSSNSSQIQQIRAFYHINEDDMILMEDVLMCPFTFRSQDAVVCGALAECVMPGMFRAHFSPRNKLLSVELVYDSMGFMQQLERASGSERSAQIIPGSLEMALSPTSTEARVITLAEPPFLIVNVNEVWTRSTKYTQMEVEGRELLALLEGEKTLPEAAERPGKPSHDFHEVAKGQCASSTNIHYDKDGREYVDYVCSYPLTNANDEITHLLHICKELPALPDSITEQ